jgi:hypothetical protein
MAAPRRSRTWIWFFGVLAVLAGAAMSISWIYNARQQLTMPELERQRALWEKAGPRDYLLEYKMTVDGPKSFVVKVRNGRVESAIMRQEGAPGDQPLRPDQYHYYDMTGLFNSIETFLKMDAEAGAKRASNRGVFDATDGHLVDFGRRVAGGQRVRIEVTRFEAGQ